MASFWTNKLAIQKDLSLVQGIVPVDIEDVFASNERPPTLKLAEETEEQHYANYIDAGESNGPDFESIQEYLNLVRNVDVAKINQNEQVLEIVKGDKSQVQLKQRKNRNAAVQSIIARYRDMSVDYNKANDDKIKKVNGFKSPSFPANMFKKKTNKKIETPKPVFPNENLRVDKPTMFVPSSFASETYQKYLESSKVKEREKDDIWSIVENKMKELDEQRKQEALLPSSSSSSSQESINDNEPTGLDFIYLPQHRHLTDSECVVCRVLCVKKQGENEPKEKK